ncbi:alpha/beta hydrolase [Trebonia kvetii]|uniref:Alpha/beta hydrolase n=2 Tax=Trebonia kvetii TaxID=2480626 RepID=A0A6P2BR43_9ACTN|nr:alpha/beta hydrolase [Trebonia kvetii]
MRFGEETTSEGVTERLFTVGDVPGVVWAAAGAAGPRPLVLIGHGGGAHKTAPAVTARARRYVTRLGVAVAAIDAPGWGGRQVPVSYEPFNAEIEELTAAGKPLLDVYARRGAVIADLAVPEWQATIDALTALDWIGSGPLGYFGVSLGSSIGVPLVAAEPRIGAAVLGLMGHETLAAHAARITVPVQVLLQWDDVIVPRDYGLALFDAIGSAEKTLHVNPGGHGATPEFEIEDSERFFARHLLA